MQFVQQNAFLGRNQNDWSIEQNQQRQQPSVESNQHLSEVIISQQSYLQSKNKLIEFITTLGQLRKTDIRPDVLQHLDQLNRNRRVVSSYLSEETILRILNSRIDKMVKNKRQKKNWSEEDIKILIWIISKYADKNAISDMEREMETSDWENIAKLIPGVTGNSCLFKWLSLKKINLASHSWSSDEGKALKNILQQRKWTEMDGYSISSINWKVIAEELYRVNLSPNKVFRSAKQCREHWNCFLNPSLKKGPWRLQEDILLLKLIRKNNGQKKWSQIVYSFQGRTQNALKNRYTLLVEKQRKISKSKQEIALVDDCLERCQAMRVNNQSNPPTIQRDNLGQENQYGANKINREQNLVSDETGGVNETESRDNNLVSRCQMQKKEECSSPVAILYCNFSDIKQSMTNWLKIKPGYLHNGNFKRQQ